MICRFRIGAPAGATRISAVLGADRIAKSAGAGHLDTPYLIDCAEERPSQEPAELSQRSAGSLRSLAVFGVLDFSLGVGRDIQMGS
jgi:hypothetical protein